MPYTLNGVGTRYYGRRNASQANGTCQSCNRWVALSSYDTRECFCLLFIPVIPLRRAFAALAAALGGRGSDEDALRAARHGHFMRLKDAYFLTSARACLDLGFPLEAAQRLASAPGALSRTTDGTRTQ